MEYFTPTSVEQAIEMLGTYAGQARVIAGGTDLMLEMHKGQAAPAALVDITRIAGLDRIDIGDQWITIGAAVTCAALRDSTFLRTYVPALALAAESLGASPIQSMATWAGNIAQAMPAADGGVVAVALQVQARLVDRDGAQWVPIEKLYLGVQSTAVDSTRQIISHLRFSKPRRGWGCAWRRIGRRPTLALPILNNAATVQLSEQGLKIVAATICLGPVASVPFRAQKAEESLIGRVPSLDTLTQAGEIAQSESHPHSNPLRASAEYRSSLVPVIVRDTLAAAIEHARKSTGEFTESR